MFQNLTTHSFKIKLQVEFSLLRNHRPPPLLPKMYIVQCTYWSENVILGIVNSRIRRFGTS